jgi:hypothetical protein
METNENIRSNEVRPAAIADETVTLELYAKNPFRLIGARVDATTREIDRQYQRAVRDVESHKAGRGLLAPSPPPTVDDLREAHQRLLDPQRRIVDEFFWFWPVVESGVVADPGLAAIKDGKLQEAIRVWNEQDGGDNAVAKHNLAVLFSLLAIDLERARESNALSKEQSDLLAKYWQTSMREWCFILQNESLWNRFTARIKEIDDPQLTEDFAGRFRNALPRTLIRIHADLAIKAADRQESEQVRSQNELIAAYEQPRELLNEVFEELLKPFREQIKALCESAARSAAAEPLRGFDAANTLIAESRPVLRLINLFLPPGNASRDYANDEVALQSFECAVDYVNKTGEWEKGRALLQTLSAVAASEGAKERLRTNLETLRTNLAGAQEQAEAKRVFGTCWYCKRHDKEDASKKELKLFGEVTRDGNNFKVLTLQIPRCKSCMNKHNLTRLITIPLTLCLVVVAAIVLGLVLLFVAGGLADSLKGVGWLGGVVVVFAIWFVWRFFLSRLPTIFERAFHFASSIVPLPGTKHEFDVKSFPTVNNALRSGFQIGSQP